jgi:hypothetical protein
MTTLPLARFGNSEILKLTRSSSERSMRTTVAYAMNPSESDARTRERLQNAAEKHPLLYRLAVIEHADEEIRTIGFSALEHEARRHPCGAQGKTQAH